jgi:hypothetical protein
VIALLESHDCAARVVTTHDSSTRVCILVTTDLRLIETACIP